MSKACEETFVLFLLDGVEQKKMNKISSTTQITRKKIEKSSQKTTQCRREKSVFRTFAEKKNKNLCPI